MFQLPFRLGFDLFHDMANTFRKQYTCYSVSLFPGNEREDVERGGKIIMPPSALEALTRLNITYPMLFKLSNTKMNRTTHCGVLEFVADENKVYLPYWMMRNLILEEGDIIDVESVSLAVATFSKFQPLSSDFLDITNPKAVLENSLRNFACLSKGDIIAIKYNRHVYELCVLETKPNDAVNIIECDMNVEFAAPLDYQDPQKNSKNEEEMVDVSKFLPVPKGFVAFSGESSRLDGKKKKEFEDENAMSSQAYQRGIPDYNYEIGTLQFFRHSRPVIQKDVPEAEDFLPFSGTGTVLNDHSKKGK